MLHPRSKNQRAFEFGIVAYQEGKRTDANPYGRLEQKEWWTTGWTHAQSVKIADFQKYVKLKALDAVDHLPPGMAEHWRRTFRDMRAKKITTLEAKYPDFVKAYAKHEEYQHG